jgi:transposase
LVLDNAAIHNGRDNKYLEDFVWKKFEVFILFLPTRASEWNPQELVWQTMCRRMLSYPIRVLRELNMQHSTARVANICLEGITHENVVGFFRHSQVLRRN